MEDESVGNTSCSWRTRNDLLKLGKGTGRLRNQRTNRIYPDYGIIYIVQNTKKSPWRFEEIAVTQTFWGKLLANAGGEKLLKE